jgi:hypothetical protein
VGFGNLVPEFQLSWLWHYELQILEGYGVVEILGELIPKWHLSKKKKKKKKSLL